MILSAAGLVCSDIGNPCPDPCDWHAYLLRTVMFVSVLIPLFDVVNQPGAVFRCYAIYFIVVKCPVNAMNIIFTLLPDLCILRGHEIICYK